MKFISDNTAPIAPEIMAAIADANNGAVTAYDGDPWSQRLNAVYSDFFETSVQVFTTVSGTAANSLALASLCPPWGTIMCHAESHIERDECGAPEFFTGGAKLTLATGDHAKITPASLEAALGIYHPMVHMVQPKMLSLTQATELGTIYSPDEVRALTDIARAHGMTTHMDGARFANALVDKGFTPADITWKAGVDVLCLGATKNGAMAAEAVIYFNKDHVNDFTFRRKRAGHLVCKGRYVAAQLLAYIETGVWERNARRANSLAQQIAAAAPQLLLHPVDANEIFLNLGDARSAQLRARGFEFYDWGAIGSGHARFVVSWDQSLADIEALVAALGALA
jgi:threonine aldolase